MFGSEDCRAGRGADALYTKGSHFLTLSSFSVGNSLGPHFELPRSAVGPRGEAVGALPLARGEHCGGKLLASG